MARRSWRRPIAVLGLMFALTTAALAAFGEVSPSRRDAESAKKKFTDIANTPNRTRRTTVSEQELNSYLVFEAAPQFPPGLVGPAVNIVGSGRVTGRAVVDLDAVRKANPPAGLLDPRTLLRGQLPVLVSGILRTKAGSGQFELESATVGGVPVPKALLQEIVSYYSKTPDNPAGIKLDDAFMLPAGIREIQVVPGQAIIVQ